jgi:UDPglucose 6-dehydrogenase
LAFKPNTDDVRFAPSIAVVQSLLAEGAIVTAYDPEAMEKTRALLPEINYALDLYEAAHGADAILILTEWDEFRSIDWVRLKQIVDRPLIIDGRNLFSPSEVASRGFTYVSTGRLSASPKPELTQQESFDDRVSQKVPLIQ